MGRLADKAVSNHKSWYSCSASVLCAFAGEAGFTEAEAKKLASPMAGGRMGRCGAVMAAERVLSEKYGEVRAQALIGRLDREFIGKNGSVMCADLRGSCRRCVTDAAAILEGILQE